jgi:hypothetical protein
MPKPAAKQRDHHLVLGGGHGEAQQLGRVEKPLHVLPGAIGAPAWGGEVPHVLGLCWVGGGGEEREGGGAYLW